MNDETTPGKRACATPRAACALGLAAGLLAAVELSPDLQRLFEPLNLALAAMTEIGLGYLEMPVSRSGAVLAHTDGFSYRITYVCSGARPAVLITVALLAVPTGWRWRLAGLGAALVGLEALNLCRLMHLYWTGVTHPEAFFFAHRVGWNAAFVAAVAGLLALWLALVPRAGGQQSRHHRSLHVHA